MTKMMGNLYKELAKCFTKDEKTTANRNVIRQANKITQNYSKGYIEPKELQHMYSELESIGISVGLISNSNKTCEWYIDGVEVENSKFVYQVHKGTGTKNEYNIYFS